MNDLISRQGAIVAVKDALLTWSYMPKWRDDKIVDAVIGVESATDNNVGAKLSTLKIERAISGLTEWQKHVQTDSDIDRDISVAVKVLKAQLSTDLAEVGTDTISRQAAIDAVGAALLSWSYMPEWRDNKIIEAVEQLPPAQPKRCRWIKLDMHRGMADHKCTACEQECYVPTCMGEPMYAFCPNCGADMRGEQDE